MATTKKQAKASAAASDAVQISEVLVSNFLAVRTLKFSCDGRYTVLTGKNGSGKSSILEAITAALKSIGRDTDVIHHDADRAEVLVKLSNGVSVDWNMTTASNSVKVRAGDDPVKKPRAFLAELLGGGLNFNPVKFCQFDPRDQVEMLLNAVPVKLDRQWLEEQLGASAEAVGLDGWDFEGHGLRLLADIRDAVYERRAEINRDRVRIEKAIEQDMREIPESADSGKFDDFDPKAARTKLADAQQKIAEHAGDLDLLDRLRQKRDSLKAERTKIEQEIERLRSRLCEIDGDDEGDDVGEMARVIADGKNVRDKVDSYVKPDTDSINRELDDYDEYMKFQGRLENIKDRKVKLEGLDETHQLLDQGHKLLKETIPAALLKATDFPIEGLQIDGDDIVIDGVKLKRHSDGEKMEIAFRLLTVLSPKFKTALVNDFHNLDDDNRIALFKCAEKYGFHLIVTVTVGKGELKAMKEAAISCATTVDDRKPAKAK